MPGRIHVSVLEAVGLPGGDTGSRDFVAVKVSLGEQECVTRHKRLHEGKTTPWNSDFAFPVLNLRDRLVVAVCDAAGDVVSRTEIEVPNILQEGFRDDVVSLNEGGQIHLILRFVLTDAEQKRLESMRAAADRRAFKERRDDMLRSYDFRRKEEYCVDNGLRTVAESKREHAGQSLDNWEVFSKKKEKEVSSAKLFALPLPQPAQPLNLKLNSPLAATDEVEPNTDDQNRRNNRWPSGIESPGDVKKLLDVQTVPTDKPSEGIALHTSSSAQSDQQEDDGSSENGDIINSELGSDPPQPPTPVKTEDARLNIFGNAEQSNVQIRSVGESARQAKHAHFVCHPPEMEERMEMPRRIQDPMRYKEGPPYQLMNPPVYVHLPKNMDVAASQAYSCQEDRWTARGSALEENMSSTTQELPHGDLASIRILESLQITPAAKEVQRSSAKRTPNGTKDVSKRLPRVREEAPVSRVGEAVQLPRVREEKQRSLPPSRSSSMVEPGLIQQEYNQEYSSTFHEPDIARLSNAWVRVETDSNLMSEQLQDCCANKETGNKLSSPLTPAAPMDGWICVERPPMTWEEALEIAKKARETVAGTGYPSTARPSPPPLSSLPLPNLTAAPVSSQAVGKTIPSSQMPPGHGPVFSPLPLPPKQNPSRGADSRGSVKERNNSFQSSLNQGPQPSLSKLENEKMELGTTPARMAVEIQDKRKGEEKLRKDETVKIRRQSSPDSAGREEWRHTNQDPEKGFSQEHLPEDSLGRDEQSRSPDGCQSNRLDIPAAEERLDKEVRENLTMQGESRDSPKVSWRLPVLEDLNVEAMENQLTEDSLTEEEFVSAVDGTLLSRSKEESENFQDQLNCKLIAHLKNRTAMEELEELEEKKVVTESPLPAVAKPIKTKDLASLDSHFCCEAHFEPQESNKLSPTKFLTSPKPVPSTLALSGDTLQAWTCIQRSVTRKSARKSFVISGNLNEEFQQTTLKGMDDPFAAAAAAARQADNIFKEKSSTLLDHLQSPPVFVAPCKKKVPKGERDISSVNESNILSHLGGAVKQVLGGVVIITGLFVLWPRNGGPVERYHVVKAGETLSSIAPGQCNDPSSTFCRMNARICDKKIIYPGQRLRLS